MPPKMEAKYEEQFTAFIDFLGFSEVSTRTDDTTRRKVLDLLLSLSELRGEFDLQSTVEEGSKSSRIKPAISTFSDHIVISYPLQPIYAEFGSDEHIAALVIITQFLQLLTRIGAAALRIGFLVRGGATIGMLYHSGGVVFGEALVDAFQIESRTSIYPRVVLSPQITSRPTWVENQPFITRDNDGLYHFDYFKPLLIGAARPGDRHTASVKEWFDEVTALVARNLTELERSRRLNELAKWAWFAREFRSGLERVNPELLKSLGGSLDAISWPK
jgi:hypothetical protein